MLSQKRRKTCKLVPCGIMLSSLVLIWPMTVSNARSRLIVGGSDVQPKAELALSSAPTTKARVKYKLETKDPNHMDTEFPAQRRMSFKKKSSINLLEGFDEKEDTGAKEESNELLEGFEDSSGKDSAAAAPSSAYQPGRLDWDGYLRLGGTYNFLHNVPDGNYPYPDWQGISGLRPELYLNFNARLFDAVRLNLGVRSWYDFVYDIKGMETFQYTGIDEQEKYEAEIEEAYLYAKVNSKIDVKIGRQIVTWGKADFLPVTNIINPLDLRSPGMLDAGRLPVGMARVDLFHNSLRLTGITIFEKRFNEIPVYGEAFWPYKYGGIDYDKPEATMENLEYAVALNYRPSAFDLSLYYADIYDNMPYIEPVVDDREGRIDYKHITHARIKMAGAAFSFPFFNTIILKGEAAYVDGLKYIANPIIPSVSPQADFSVTASGQSSRRVDGLVAFEYTGITDTILIGEFLANYKIDYQSLIVDDDTEVRLKTHTQDDYDFGWSAGVNRSLLRDTLNLKLGMISYQQQNADVMVQTLVATYDLTDAIQFKGALIFYDIKTESDLVRDDLSDNDRIYLEIKYSF